MKSLFLAAALMTAVQTHAGVLDPSRPIGPQISVESGEFDAKVRYFGPDLQAKLLDSDRVVTYLTVTRDRKSGAVEWGVVLSAQYNDRWRYYETASLVGGKVLSAQNLGRQVGVCYRGSCSLSEGAGVVLADADVQAAMANGLRLRWNARGYGGFDVEFSAAYFAAMAEAVKR